MSKKPTIAELKKIMESGQKFEILPSGEVEVKDATFDFTLAELKRLWHGLVVIRRFEVTESFSRDFYREECDEALASKLGDKIKEQTLAVIIESEPDTAPDEIKTEPVAKENQ